MPAPWQPFSSFDSGIQDQLRASEQGDGFSALLGDDRRIPHLGATAAMYQGRPAFHDSPADRAQKIRLKLDGGMCRRALGQRLDGTRSTETVSKAQQHRRVNKPIGRQKLGPDLNLPDHGAGTANTNAARAYAADS